jgi:hypothetical protein
MFNVLVQLVIEVLFREEITSAILSLEIERLLMRCESPRNGAFLQK